MIKNKLDYKLINLAIIALIVFLVYQTGSLWLGITNKILSIILPFFFAFVVAYALHPLLRYFQSKKIKKGYAVIIVIAIVVGIMTLFLGLVIPLLFNQLSSLFSGITAFLKEITTRYDVNLGPLQTSLTTSFNDIILGMGNYISNGALSALGVSLSYIATFFIAFSAAIYFLIDFDNIRAGFKTYLLHRSKRAYLYFRALDREMKHYLSGFIKVVFISLIEYTVAFTIIGHPNAILLGFLAALGNLIPYFGGIMVNTLATITAFVISPALFIRTLITFFVLSTVDGYVINPYVYGKTNKIHPLFVILAVFAGGIIFGLMGIIIALPLAITLLTTYKFFKEDINEKLEDIKENKKKN